MFTQISIFAENRKGAMHKITHILAENKINIITLITNDSAEFGIVRMIVSDPQLAYEKLTEGGYLVHKESVMAVEMSDNPGGMDGLLDDIEKSNINLDYIYISYDRERSTPIAIIHAGDSAELEESLEAKGHTVL